MELSKESWHSKLYRFTYISELPQSLCPYFWKLVLSIVLFIPLTILFIPLIIGRFLFEYSYFRYPTYFKKKDLLFMVMINCWTWNVYWIVKALFHKEWVLILIVFVGVLILLLIIFIKHNLFPSKNEPKKEKPKKEKQPSILTEFIKGKMGKYCPKINWQ